MGFRKGSYATIWEITPASDVRTKGRISISKKNKNTGEYETDFSGFVSFLGTTAATKAAKLKRMDRIRLGDVDCTVYYDKEKRVSYYNFNIFSFETQDEIDAESGGNLNAAMQSVDSGEQEPQELPY